MNNSYHRIFRSITAYGLLMLFVIVTSCNNQPDTVTLHNGDLLFQICESSTFSEAIVDATARGKGPYFTHVGIFTVTDGDSTVIEASSERGVVATSLKDFRCGCPGIVVMRVADSIPVEQAVTRAKMHIGKDYDWEFDADNDKMYCSELVQAAFLDRSGTPIFESVPMNFMDESGEMPDFWTTLFNSLGKPIPQGQPGTNPNSIFASPYLRQVGILEQ